MIKIIDSNKNRVKRHQRIRNKISGTTARPRLNVFRSTKNIYVQLIDDTANCTLCAASTLDTDIGTNGGNIEAAKKIGIEIAKRAKEKGITDVVFDRGGYLYHGRVAALAEGAREGGLNF